ncbi:glycosyl hydrolase family 98 C-terminal domain-containing protein [Ruminococcus sp.]|uniref:glycosyl hydrolase family 98 C-terminal domain-containing protein n=1 Tax=Ruminococcus sp. TaxID=41978 RepID=UPI002E7A669C|nr:glycosyl hydrolase family 98 C-terminal domain-containing protein [Ruminococcus sp.]MEE1397844.1 glycosyl hydrolase family 98 C-terminal domain-containing protein [Ruminococcus sp.]
MKTGSDIFRKVQDGTIRIPSRSEAVERTKVVVIQNVNSGSNDDKYSTYPTLFEGLYRMENDGNLKDNHNLYKSNGRYPTVPTVYALADDLAKSIPVQIKQSEIPSRWSTIAAKQQELNKLFPLEYWGNCYAGRNENTWVTYNPFKDGTLAGGYLSLQYNTCKELACTYSAYTTGIIREYSDAVDIYVNNYDEEDAKTLKTNTFKIYSCTAEPTLTYTDRGINQAASEVTTSYADGMYTITVKQNGPVDISVKCSGSETNRQTAYQEAAYTAPAFPSFYTGIWQYEGEFFDTKNVEGNVTNGFSRPDLFGYVGAMCPAPGLTTDLIPADQLKFNGVSPYLLFVSAGSNDQIVWSSPKDYHDTMTQNGTRHIWHTVTGGDHGGKTIRPHMYNYIRAIFHAS